MISIRGAITVSEDSSEEVLGAVRELLQNIINRNNLSIDEIISIIFTCTNDIKSIYPAVAARELGITDSSLMCISEMYVEGSLTKCIRVMLLVNKDIRQSEAHHIYMREAKKLRPDLIEKIL